VLSLVLLAACSRARAEGGDASRPYRGGRFRLVPGAAGLPAGPDPGRGRSL